MVSVLHQEALEADRAQVVLAEGLDVLQRVDLAPAVLKLTDLIVTHFLRSLLSLQFKYYNYY
jgi:hypothetical protein